MPLSKFPETFSLNLTTHFKGDFPFKFNISDNQNYIGPMPDIEFNATDTNKDKKTRDVFIAWHDHLVKSNYIFDFQKKCTRTVHKMRPFYDYVQTIPNITFVEGFPENLNDMLCTNCLVIVDDLMSQCSQNQSMSDLFTKGSHHRGYLSCI